MRLRRVLLLQGPARIFVPSKDTLASRQLTQSLQSFSSQNHLCRLLWRHVIFMYECSMEESCPLITKSWHFKVNSPPEACQEEACYCAVVWKLHWGSLFALSAPRWTFTRRTLPKQWTNSHQRRDTPLFPDVRSASHLFVIIWGSSSDFEFRLNVQFWPFISSPITIRSSAAPFFVPLFSAKARLAHCWGPQTVKHPHWIRVCCPLTL